MKKSKKFLSIFAILFVAIFALSCCFFAACGSSDNDEKDDDNDKKTEDTTGGDDEKSNDGETKKEDDTQSGGGPTWTQVVYLATADDVAYTTADVASGTAVFENNADLQISSEDGLTYTVSGTASVMGEAEAEWWSTDDTTAGDMYVVIKIAVAEGETIYFGNSEKSYTNDGDGAADFDNGYLFIVCKLAFDEESTCTSEMTWVVGESKTAGITYTVDFSGVTCPEAETDEVASWDFTDTSLFGTGSLSYNGTGEINENTEGVQSTTDTINGTEKTVYYIGEGLKYLDGTDTGLTCLQSSEKITKVDGSTQRVNFGGGVKTYQSCLIYSLGAGTYTITMSYYTGTIGSQLSGDSVGRYATIIDADGKDLCGTADEQCKTKETSAIESRTVTISLDAATNIYFGSASSGLYLTAIKICK